MSVLNSVKRNERRIRDRSAEGHRDNDINSEAWTVGAIRVVLGRSTGQTDERYSCAGVDARVVHAPDHPELRKDILRRRPTDGRITQGSRSEWRL